MIMQRLWILSYLLMSSYLHQITLGRRTDKSFSCSHTSFYVSLPLLFCSLSIVLCARNFSCRIWKSLPSFRVAGSESEQVLASLVLRQLCLFCLTGLISFEEFHQTWKLFSSHMNIELTDDGINDLVRSIDFNKDGNIDFNEFLEAFRLVKQSQQWEARAGHHIQCLVCFLPNCRACPQLQARGREGRFLMLFIEDWDHPANSCDPFGEGNDKIDKLYLSYDCIVKGTVL